MRGRTVTVDGYQITNPLDLQYLEWCQEQADRINRDPARRAHVKEEDGTCTVYDYNPPKLVYSSALRDTLLNKRFRN